MKHIALVAILSVVSAPAFASDYAANMNRYVEGEIAGWATDPAMVEAIRAQNKVTADYDEQKILALDAEWRSQVTAGKGRLIDPVLTSPTAEFLRKKVAGTSNKVSEVLITDAKGLNVAGTSMTSDYWQGDEDKYTKTFLVGSGATTGGEVDFDESWQSYQAEYAFTISDPDSGEPIGSMVVSLFPDEF